MTPEIPGVKGLVARLLLQDRDLTTREMHRRAVERYPQVQDVSLREFNARYVLQVKRNMVGRKPRRPLPMPDENGTRPEPAPPSPDGSDDAEEGLDLLRRAAAEARQSLRDSSSPPPADPTPSSTGSGGSIAATAPDGSVSDREDKDPPPAEDAKAASSTASSAGTPSSAPFPLTAVTPPEQAERRPPRETLRVLFFKLALELELSRNNSELVDVIAGVDRYVDEALAAVRG